MTTLPIRSVLVPEVLPAERGKKEAAFVFARAGGGEAAAVGWMEAEAGERVTVAAYGMLRVGAVGSVVDVYG